MLMLRKHKRWKRRGDIAALKQVRWVVNVTSLASATWVRGAFAIDHQFATQVMPEALLSLGS
jgi:hypothetical protein